MPIKTLWTTERLKRLCDHYNRKYWRRQLRYRVVIEKISENFMSCISFYEKKNSVDPAKHASDRELRATLLHEMAHEAARGKGHGVKFFAQVERLLRRGAPIAVSYAEAGAEARIYANLVPPQFPLPDRFFSFLTSQRNGSTPPLVS